MINSDYQVKISKQLISEFSSKDGSPDLLGSFGKVIKIWRIKMSDDKQLELESQCTGI